MLTDYNTKEMTPGKDSRIKEQAEKERKEKERRNGNAGVDVRRTFLQPHAREEDTVAARVVAATVNAAFRRLAKKAHPDAGGDSAAYIRLTEARDVLMETVG